MVTGKDDPFVCSTACVPKTEAIGDTFAGVGVRECICGGTDVIECIVAISDIAAIVVEFCGPEDISSRRPVVAAGGTTPGVDGNEKSKGIDGMYCIMFDAIMVGTSRDKPEAMR